jgi:hypothetical protein
MPQSGASAQDQPAARLRGRDCHHRAGDHPPHPVGQSSRHGKDRAWRPLRPCLGGASLARRSGRPLGVGFCAVPPMAAPDSPSRRQPQASALPAASLAGRNALVELDDLIQVAREALLRSVPLCKPGEPAEPDQRRCITGGSVAPPARAGAAGAHLPPAARKGHLPAGPRQPRCPG